MLLNYEYEQCIAQKTGRLTCGAFMFACLFACVFVDYEMTLTLHCIDDEWERVRCKLFISECL